MQHRILLALILSIAITAGWSQPSVGINIDPQRALHVYGNGHQFTRLRSTSFATAKTGIELVRGDGDNFSTDWRMINDAGTFKIQYSSDEFTGDITEALRILGNGNVGIGTTSPVAPLHINGGTSVGSGGGYLRLGPASQHMSFDYRDIAATSNGGTHDLYLQRMGGNTIIGITGGNTYMATGESSVVGLGTTFSAAKFQVDNDGYQMYLRNAGDGSTNGWYIGASRAGWAVGDNQLIFTPSGSSDDAVLRLMDVTDNNGDVAPVMIHTTDAQTLLLDGNEIDTKGASLYINHNSDHNTYFNSNGGLVGIGTTNPQATLHIKTASVSNPALILQKNAIRWEISPSTVQSSLVFRYNDTYMAQVSGVNGNWDNVSDKRLKKEIKPLPGLLDKVKGISTYTYSFKHDEDKTRYIGVIAQELKKYFPEMVFEAEDQYGVAYAQLAVVALKAIQEQQETIHSLRTRLQKLKQNNTVGYSGTATQVQATTSQINK